MYKLYTDDILNWAKNYHDSLFHACFCDPPYHLTSIVKRFGKPDSAPAQFGTDGAYARHSAGFMSQIWDGGDTSFRPETWDAIASCLFPGAYLLAFGGTRTWYRLAIAIEDAGFEIRDTVMYCYGAGFPKSHNLHGIFEGYGSALKPAWESVIMAQKPIDSRTELHIIVSNLYRLEAQLWLLLYAKTAVENTTQNQVEYEKALTIAQWDAEKLNNILDDLSAQMDMSQLESMINSILSTVSLWLSTWVEFLKNGNTFITSMVINPIIDLKTLNCSSLALTPLCIIQEEINQRGSWLSALPAARILNAVSMKLYAILELSAIENAIDKGLMPSPDAIDKNVLARPIIIARKPLDGTIAQNCTQYGSGALNIDGCRVQGESVPINKLEEWSGFGQKVRPDYVQEMNNKGRFPANLIHDGSDEVRDGFPHSTSGAMKKPYKYTNNGYSLGAPAGNTKTICEASEGSAARFFYTAKVSPSERNAGMPEGEKCNHPTLKPLALTEYLSRLILPPAEYAPRRLLVPFSGSGSEMIGAHQAGWEEIIGVELSPEYTEIAEKRLKYWTNIPKQLIFK